jgi:hypothetical protein
MIDTTHDRYALIANGGYTREWSAEWIPRHYTLKRVHIIGHPGCCYHDYKHAVAEGSYEAMRAAKRLLDPPPERAARVEV